MSVDRLLSEDDEPVRPVPDAVRKAWERKVPPTTDERRKAASQAVQRHRERRGQTSEPDRPPDRLGGSPPSEPDAR